MHHNTRIYFIVAISLVVFVANSADTYARRFFRRSSNSYGTSGLKSIASTSDGATAGYRSLAAYYSYDKAMSEEVAFTDRVRIFMLIKDQKILESSDSVVAEVRFTDLSNSAETKVRYIPVSFDSTSTNFKLGVLDVANEPGEEAVIEPAKVYRMFVNLHKKSDTYGKDTAFGQLVTPYYVATADDTRLGRARQHIAMRTFKEYYYAEKGWASEENYPMDCYAYYMWATGSCTVGAQNGRTVLGRLFGNLRPFDRGSSITTLAQKGAIHGDYVRMSGHSFMLLAYDKSTRCVWTMEGNFNSTIEIINRSVDSSWTVGHLVEEHVNPQLFRVSHTASVDNPPTASGGESGGSS